VCVCGIHRSFFTQLVRIVEHLEKKTNIGEKTQQIDTATHRCIVDQLPVHELSRNKKIIKNERTTKLMQKKIP
jgi:hypothetical protein